MSRSPATPRVKTLGEHIEAEINTLERLLPLANNLRRRHLETEQLLDGLDGSGNRLRRLARG